MLSSVELQASGHDLTDLLYHLLDEWLGSGNEGVNCSLQSGWAHGCDTSVIHMEVCRVELNG